jgi:hypothetical protein
MIRCSMTRLLCVRLGAGPSSATLVNLHIVRRVALSQANIWSSLPAPTAAQSHSQQVPYSRTPQRSGEHHPRTSPNLRNQWRLCFGIVARGRFDTFGTPSGNVRCLRVAAVYFVVHLRRSLFTGWPTRWALSGHHTAPMGLCPRSRGFWMRRLKDKAGTTIHCVESETRLSLPHGQFCASA